jgi:hypothetical protein
MEHPPCRYQDDPTSTMRTQHDAVHAMGNAAHGEAIGSDRASMHAIHAIQYTRISSIRGRFHRESSCTRQQATHSHLQGEQLQVPTVPSSRIHPMHVMRGTPQARRGSSPRTASRNLLKSSQRMRCDESSSGSFSSTSSSIVGITRNRSEFNPAGATSLRSLSDVYEQRTPTSGPLHNRSTRPRTASLTSSSVSNALEAGHDAPLGATRQILAALDERSVQQRMQSMLDRKNARSSLHALSVATSGATSVAAGVHAERADSVPFSSLNRSVPESLHGANLHWDIVCVHTCACVCKPRLPWHQCVLDCLSNRELTPAIE